MKKICFVTTVSITMKSFVVEIAKHLHNECGYDVTLICNTDDEFKASLPEYIRYIPVKMARGIDFSALGSIKEFVKIFKTEKFDLVQYSTPNASCYASIAAKIAKVPVRLYAQWGIRYVGLSGLSRKIFKFIEKMVCSLSTHVRAVSFKNMQFAVEEGLYPNSKANVIGNGGTIGVDMFDYDISKKEEWKNKVLSEYSINADDFVFGFVGRVSADKGCTELLTAFKNIVAEKENAKLLMVGPLEDNCGISKELIDWARNSKQVVLTGMVQNKEMKRYYCAMDILVHPTYREGFGMVIQEAGALAVATITTKIPGASEVMVDGESCVLVNPKNTEELENAMTNLIENRKNAKAIGEEAYNRTKKLYDRPIMLENLKKEYTEILEEK
jgi:glycosyltransferase involved in cell wall biosynthesis